MDTPMREPEPSGPAGSPAHATVSVRPSRTSAEQRARNFARFVWSGRFVDWVFAGLACLLLLAGLASWLMMGEPFYVVVVVFLEIFLLVVWVAIRIEHREVFRVRAMSSPTSRDLVNALMAAEKRRRKSDRLLGLFMGPLFLGLFPLMLLILAFSSASLLEWLASLLYTALFAPFVVWLLWSSISRKPSNYMRALRRMQVQGADSETAEDDPPPSEDA